MIVRKVTLKRLIKEAITQKEINGIMGLIDADEINQAVSLFEMLSDDMTEKQISAFNEKLIEKTIAYLSTQDPDEFIAAIHALEDLGAIPEALDTHIHIPYRKKDPGSWRKFGKRYAVYLGYENIDTAKKVVNFIKNNTKIEYARTRTNSAIKGLRNRAKYYSAPKRKAIDLANLPDWDLEIAYITLL